jgi:hypothetical protein
MFNCKKKMYKPFGRGLPGGKRYSVPYGTVVTGILDMRPGKHDLHFLVGVELLPHAFVSIPDEKMHIGVYLFLLVILYSCIYVF